MTAIITRTGKGSALTHLEMDANLDSLSGINEARTTTSEVIAAADQGKTLEFSNASTVTVTLTAIATIIAAIDTSDFTVRLKNIGAGSVTVTPSTDTFDDGDATKSLAQYEYLIIQTDNSGTKWNVIGQGFTQGTGGGFDADTVDGLEASQFLRKDADDTTTGNLTISKASPVDFMEETDASATEKVWGTRLAAGSFRVSTYTDLKAVVENPLVISRAGTAVSTITLTSIDINLVGQLQINGTDVTSTAAELNILDGVTSTTAELNILDGVTSTAAELNILDGVTSTAAELNILDGVTSTAAELNILDGVTATFTELNLLDGVTSTTAELNILDGVTSTAAEINYNDITALGTTENSKTVTTDASGNINMPAGDGIALGGGADYLNVYEEGTWTPALQDSSASDAEGQTYSFQLGYYTRIGRVVFISGYISMTSIGTLSGSVRLAGLPITPAGTSQDYGSLTAGDVLNMNLAAGTSITGIIAGTNTYVSLKVFDVASGTSDLLASEVSTDGKMHFTGTYNV